MASERQATIEAIIEAYQTVSRAISAAFGPAWMKLDLSMAQLKTLLTLYNAGPLPIGQIADMLGVGQPTASHLVDRLVQVELVVRTEDSLDRRRTLAQLSPDGVQLAEQLRQVRSEPLQRWLAQLDGAALTALQQGLAALADAAQSETNPISKTT
jgi:MarR family transcriptional regulator, organic hydroperoxide resistance regulator